jgi:DNA-binding response OmpR family regulator
MARILVIEDEPDLQHLLRVNLQRDGHLVTVAGTGTDGLLVLRKQGIDLVLLDLMLPDRDGLEVCRTIRADPGLAALPIIMVTAKSEESDVVLGLGLGADDYIAKPFRIRELLARVRSRLERTLGADDPARKRIQVQGLLIDPVAHRVVIDGTPAPLTLTEFRLLHALASQPGVAFARYDILDRLRDSAEELTDRTVDAHIRNLRAKMRPYEHLIETVRGIGYRFATDV